MAGAIAMHRWADRLGAQARSLSVEDLLAAIPEYARCRAKGAEIPSLSDRANQLAACNMEILTNVFRAFPDRLGLVRRRGWLRR